jgi:drug/metabolite transporter (DMT)-like permease
VLFSTGGAAIKTDAFSALQVSSGRSAIAALTLLLVLRGRVRCSRGLLATAVLYGATLTSFVAATKLTTAASAIFLQSSAPIYLLCIGPMVLGEKPGRRDLGYAAAMGVGLVLCFAGQPPSSGTAPNPLAGNLFGLASSIGWAGTLAGLRLSSRERGDGLSAVLLGNVLAAVVGGAWALPFPSVGLIEWLPLVYMGVVQISVAYILLTRALGRLPALEVSLLLLMEPVLNPVWTWLMHGEAPGRSVVAGGACILLASALKARQDG